MQNTDYRDDADGRMLLYKGPMVLEGPDTSVELEGEIFLSYLPSPTVRFEGKRNEAADIEPTVKHRLRLPASHCYAATILHTELQLEPQSSTFRVRGRVEGRLDKPAWNNASSGRFLVMNFPPILGRPIEVGRNWSGLARVSLSSDQWRIDIDRATDSSKRLERLKESGGFAWTASALIRRPDNSRFSAEDFCDALDGLFYYLSFTAGRWTGLCLPEAYDAADDLVGDDWTCQPTTPYRNVASWAATDRPECFEQPYGQFCELYADPYWREVLVIAIHWYIEANNQAGKIEGSIALTQTALELLAATILVEQEKWISHGAYDKLPAGDRLRLLSKWAGIPASIPTELNELVTLANDKQNRWLDGAHAFVEIRNSIIHPTKKNRERFKQHSTGARVDAWLLGLWMVELVLLRLFGYRGLYVRRTARGAAKALETVPWAATPSP